MGQSQPESDIKVEVRNAVEIKKNQPEVQEERPDVGPLVEGLENSLGDFVKNVNGQLMANDNPAVRALCAKMLNETIPGLGAQINAIKETVEPTLDIVPLSAEARGKLLVKVVERLGNEVRETSSKFEKDIALSGYRETAAEKSKAEKALKNTPEDDKAAEKLNNAEAKLIAAEAQALKAGASEQEIAKKENLGIEDAQLVTRSQTLNALSESALTPERALKEYGQAWENYYKFNNVYVAAIKGARAAGEQFNEVPYRKMLTNLNQAREVAGNAAAKIGVSPGLLTEAQNLAQARAVGTVDFSSLGLADGATVEEVRELLAEKARSDLEGAVKEFYLGGVNANGAIELRTQLLGKFLGDAGEANAVKGEFETKYRAEAGKKDFANEYVKYLERKAFRDPDAEVISAEALEKAEKAGVANADIQKIQAQVSAEFGVPKEVSEANILGSLKKGDFATLNGLSNNQILTAINGAVAKEQAGTGYTYEYALSKAGIKLDPTTIDEMTQNPYEKFKG